MAEASQTVLVTGAGGFIGGKLAAALAARGAHVRAGVRRPLPGPVPAGVQPVACDLDEPSEIVAAAAGADVVMHAAYGDEAARVRQCAELLGAMAHAGVGNLVYFSSIAVYGERGGAVTEATPPAGRLSRYGAAKRDCEALIAAWVAEAAPVPRRAAILRPGIVYGTGSRFFVDKLADRIGRGVWGTFGAAGEGIAALIHVDDVAAIATAAALTLASADRTLLAPVETVHLVGPETLTWNAYFAALAASMGAAPLRPMEGGRLAARRALGIAAKIWRRLGLPGGRSAALAPSGDELALFGRRAVYSSGRAPALFGVAPVVGLAEGLSRTEVNRGRST